MLPYLGTYYIALLVILNFYSIAVNRVQSKAVLDASRRHCPARGELPARALHVALGRFRSRGDVRSGHSLERHARTSTSLAVFREQGVKGCVRSVASLALKVSHDGFNLLDAVAMRLARLGVEESSLGEDIQPLRASRRQQYVLVRLQD